MGVGVGVGVCIFIYFLLEIGYRVIYKRGSGGVSVFYFIYNFVIELVIEF